MKFMTGVLLILHGLICAAPAIEAFVDYDNHHRYQASLDNTPVPQPLGRRDLRFPARGPCLPDFITPLERYRSY